MLISEFIKRTGFRPTENYYHSVIEPEYNRSKLDKDAWCKQWKKNGGIQKAYDAMSKQAANEYDNVLHLEEEIKNLKEQKQELKSEVEELNIDNKGWVEAAHQAEDRMNEANNNVQSMMHQLIDISELYSSSELRQLVIEHIGFRRYITYKLENGMAIWELDKADIMDNLKD